MRMRCWRRTKSCAPGSPCWNTFGRSSTPPRDTCWLRSPPESLQCTDARLISARISFHHARVLADAFTYSPAAEHIKAAEVELLDLAEGMVFDVWARHVAGRVREYEREHQNRDPGTVEPDPRRREFLKLSPTWDGRLRVRGYLNDVAGAVTGETLNRVADELFHQFTHTHKLDPTTKIPGRGELLSMALVETCRRASTSDPATSRAATPEVTLVVHADEPDTAYTPEGVKLQDNTIRTLLCDPAMFPIVVSSLGVPLDMGRDIRHVNGAQRRALEHRDGGCTFQGCPTPPRWCDAHHIDWWDRDNGTTDVKKSTLACRFHHHLIHNHNWTVHLTDDGWTIWTNPQRKPIWGQQHHRTRAGPTPNR